MGSQSRTWELPLIDLILCKADISRFCCEMLMMTMIIVQCNIWNRKSFNLRNLDIKILFHWDHYLSHNLKYAKICKQQRGGSHGSCSTETIADYVKLPIMRLHAAGGGNGNVVQEKPSKQRLTHGFKLKTCVFFSGMRAAVCCILIFNAPQLQSLDDMLFLM